MPSIPKKSDAPKAPPTWEQQAADAAKSMTISGVLFVIAFVLALWTWNKIPRATSDDATIQAFYNSVSDMDWLDRVGGLLMPLASVSFLWFVAKFRDWQASYGKHRVSNVYTTVQLATGGVFVALLLAAAAVATSVNADVAADAGLARFAIHLGNTMAITYAMRMAAVFVLATAHAAKNANAQPGWMLGVSYVIAILLYLQGNLDHRLSILFPIYILMLCLWALRSHPNEQGEAVAG